MRPQPIKIGPFTGGINAYSDPSAIDNSELSDCVNFELDLDGSLVCRPSFRRANQTALPSDNFPWGANSVEIIGSGVWPSSVRLFASNTNGTWALASQTGTWTKIDDNRMNAAVPVAGTVLFVPENAGQGFYWNPTEKINDATIPRGRMAVYFKGRLWIAPGKNPPLNSDQSKLKYTDPIIAYIAAGFMPVWDSDNQFQVQAGDGQDLTDIIVYQDQLILFKNDSTYVHAYDTGEPKDGLIRVVHTLVGASSRDCVVQYEDATYVMHQGNVYEIVNYNFEQINTKCPFIVDGAIPGDATSRTINVGLSVVGDRLICRYFNRIYVFGLLTRAWTRYESVVGRLQNVGMFWPWPTDTIRDTPLRYYAGSVISNYGSIIECVDGRAADVFETWDLTTRERIKCKIWTKVFDMEDPFHFKKLKWWGADVFCNTEVIGEAVPIVIHSGTRWNQAELHPWSDLETWEQPLAASISIRTTVSTEAPVKRKFIKFLKALRFRQIYYYIEMWSDGSTVTGPCRLFSLATIVGSKEQVVKQVS